MEQKLGRLFYNETSLKSYKFVFFLPKYTDSARLQLSTRIDSVGGKVSFSYNEENIIVIDKIDDVKSNTIKRHLQNFHLILIMDSKKILCFYDENLEANDKKLDTSKYRVIKNEDFETIINEYNKKNMNDKMLSLPIKIVRLICYKDLIEIIEEVEPNTLELHYRQGLPRNVDTGALISLVNFNMPENNRLEFFSFPKIKKEKSSKNKSSSYYFYGSGGKSSESNNDIDLLDLYDIPKYDKNNHQGYSIFASNEERKILETHFKKKKKDQLNTENKPEKNIKYNLNTPEPRKDHYFCHICQFRFENYKEHSESDIHKQNIFKNREQFGRIDELFKRIENFWSKKETEAEEYNLNNLHFDDNSIMNKIQHFSTNATITSDRCDLGNKISTRNLCEIKDLNKKHKNGIIKQNIEKYLEESKQYFDEVNIKRNVDLNRKIMENYDNKSIEFKLKSLIKINCNEKNIFDTIMNDVEEDNRINKENNKIKLNDKYENNNCQINPFDIDENKNKNFNIKNTKQIFNNSILTNIIINHQSSNINRNDQGQKIGVNIEQEDFNAEYRKILRNKSIKPFNGLKERSGLDYTLEKQIPIRDYEQIVLEKKQRYLNLNSNFNSHVIPNTKISETVQKATTNTEKIKISSKTNLEKKSFRNSDNESAISDAKSQYSVLKPKNFTSVNSSKSNKNILNMNRTEMLMSRNFNINNNKTNYYSREPIREMSIQSGNNISVHSIQSTDSKIRNGSQYSDVKSEQNMVRFNIKKKDSMIKQNESPYKETDTIINLKSTSNKISNCREDFIEFDKISVEFNDKKFNELNNLPSRTSIQNNSYKLSSNASSLVFKKEETSNKSIINLEENKQKDDKLKDAHFEKMPNSMNENEIIGSTQIINSTFKVEVLEGKTDIENNFGHKNQSRKNLIEQNLNHLLNSEIIKKENLFPEKQKTRGDMIIEIIKEHEENEEVDEVDEVDEEISEKSKKTKKYRDGKDIEHKNFENKSEKEFSYDIEITIGDQKNYGTPQKTHKGRYLNQNHLSPNSKHNEKALRDSAGRNVNTNDKDQSAIKKFNSDNKSKENIEFLSSSKKNFLDSTRKIEFQNFEINNIEKSIKEPNLSIYKDNYDIFKEDQRKNPNNAKVPKRDNRYYKESPILEGKSKFSEESTEKSKNEQMNTYSIETRSLKKNFCNGYMMNNMNNANFTNERKSSRNQNIHIDEIIPNEINKSKRDLRKTKYSERNQRNYITFVQSNNRNELYLFPHSDILNKRKKVINIKKKIHSNLNQQKETVAKMENRALSDGVKLFKY